MLNEIERRLTALVGDGLQTRQGLSVVQAPTDVQLGVPGTAIVRVALVEVAPLAGSTASIHLGQCTDPASTAGACSRRD